MDRRAIEALLALYRLEPGIREVYLEGSSDSRIMNFWAIQRRVGLTAFEISSVDVPATVVAQCSEIPNNRGRVVALATFLEGRLGRGFRQALFVIDADFDYLLMNEGVGIAAQAACIRRTDYACMEMYAFREEAFRKFFVLACGVATFDWSALRPALVNSLQWLFVVRAAIQTLQWDAGLLAPDRDMTLDGRAFRLDKEGYLRRVLNSAGMFERARELRCEIERHANALMGDDRRFMHGHDLMRVTSWLARRTSRNFRSASDEAIESSFKGCWEAGFCDGQSLFDGIVEWAKS